MGGRVTLETLLHNLSVDCVKLLPDDNPFALANPRLTEEQIALKRAYLQAMPGERQALTLAKQHVQDLGLKFNIRYARPELAHKYSRDLNNTREKLNGKGGTIPLQDLVNVPARYEVKVRIIDGEAKIEETIWITSKSEHGLWTWYAESDIGSNAKIKSKLEKAKQHYLIIQVSDKPQALALARTVFAKEAVQSVVVYDSTSMNAIESMCISTQLRECAPLQTKSPHERVKAEERARRRYLKS